MPSIELGVALYAILGAATVIKVALYGDARLCYRSWLLALASASIHILGLKRLGKLRMAVSWRSVLRGAAEDVGLHAGAG